MKKLLTLVALGLTLSFGAAQAQDQAKTPQQTKMAKCNTDAAGKKGDERKAFMKTCLSAKKQTAAAMTGKEPQQTKMKTCNTEAADKKGVERKKFMRECLKKTA